MKLRRPSWFAVLLTVFGVCAFVRLGIWQLHRATEKEQLLARFAQASDQPLQDFAAVAAKVGASAFPHLGEHGRYLGAREYVLDNQERHDRPGVVVFAPFLPCRGDACEHGDGRVLLLGLGFLARHGDMRELPPLPPLPQGEVDVRGLYMPPPGSGLRLGGDALVHQHDWPKLTTYIDLGEVGKDLGRDLYPRVLLLDADPATPYLRAWTPDVMPPARHRAYAFQWFSFAVAALAIFVVLHRVRDDNDDEDHHDAA
jgi:cytochrome oxidase assembly protein ShyY1